MALRTMTALLDVLEPSSHQQPNRVFDSWERSLIKSIVTMGNSQCLASLVHLHCTPVSWHNANKVGRLYLIPFIDMKTLPVGNKGKEEIR